MESHAALAHGALRHYPKHRAKPPASPQARKLTKRIPKYTNAPMQTIPLHKWDSTEHLQTEADMALYLQTCFDEAGDDAAFIAKALGTIARAKGMTQLARDTGIGRESLYKALSGEGNPSFATVLKVMSALGLSLNASVKHA